jgi:hypothetical protein
MVLRSVPTYALAVVVGLAAGVAVGMVWRAVQYVGEGARASLDESYRFSFMEGCATNPVTREHFPAREAAIRACADEWEWRERMRAQQWRIEQ